MSDSPKSTYHMPVDGQLLSPIMATDRQTSHKVAVIPEPCTVSSPAYVNIPKPYPASIPVPVLTVGEVTDCPVDETISPKSPTPAEMASNLMTSASTFPWTRKVVSNSADLVTKLVDPHIISIRKAMKMNSTLRRSYSKSIPNQHHSESVPVNENPQMAPPSRLLATPKSSLSTASKSRAAHLSSPPAAANPSPLVTLLSSPPTAAHASPLVAAYLSMPAVPKSGPPTTFHSRPPSTADSSPPAALNSSHPAATDSSVPAQCNPNQRRRMRRKRQHSALILCIELTPVQAPAPDQSPVQAPAPDQSPVQAPAPDQSPVSASRNRFAAPASWEHLPVPAPWERPPVPVPRKRFEVPAPRKRYPTSKSSPRRAPIPQFIPVPENPVLKSQLGVPFPVPENAVL